jgi:hypothetical protein
VYGLDVERDASRGVQLGNVGARGESGALLVPLATFARLRSNPFFAVIRTKVAGTLPPETKGPEALASPGP